MVKSKKSSLTLLDLPKSVVCMNTFASNVKSSTLLIYGAIIVLLISVLNVVKGIADVNPTSVIESFLYTLIGLPLILFVVYLLFIIFLNAFEGKSKDFQHSYLVFSAITLPFILIGHILNWLSVLFTNYVVMLLFSLLLAVLFVYYVFNFVINFKNYYKTTGYRVVSSLIIADIIFIFIGIIQYFATIMSSLI